MTIWVDAQISPRIARWISTNVSVAAIPVRDLNLRDAEDEVIYSAAQTANVIVLTKDSDFVQLQERRGPPPKIIWLTCGNTSNALLEGILERNLARALDLLNNGEALVEIGAP